MSRLREVKRLKNDGELLCQPAFSRVQQQPGRMQIDQPPTPITGLENEYMVRNIRD